MKTTGLLLLVLVLVLGVLPAYGTVGLGLSHYEPNLILHPGESGSYAIGKVYVVGDEALRVQTLWRQTSGPCQLPVTLNWTNVIFEANTDMEVYLTVTIPDNASYLGNYSGEVALGGRYLNMTGEGSFAVPGGTLKANFTVQKKPEGGSSLWAWTIVGLCVCAPVLGIFSLVAVKRRQKKPDPLLET